MDASRARRNTSERLVSKLAWQLLSRVVVKQTNKPIKKLVLDTEKIKLLDSQRLAEVVGGGPTYTCTASTRTPLSYTCKP
jgi:hypothetical protein